MKIRLKEFDQNIAKLFSGTAIAQLISFISLPIIAKQYGPSEYGIYGGFVAATSILGILSTGKYELAIVISNKRSEVEALINLSFHINFIICFLIAVLVVTLPMHTLNWLFGIDTNNRLIFLIIPLLTYLIGTFQVLNYSLVREKKFTTLSINKILRSSLFGLFAITMGFFLQKAQNIAIALTVSYLLSNIFLRIKVREYYVNTNTLLNTEWIGIIKNVSKKYYNFPLYTLPSEFMNVVCTQLPVFVFLLAFSTTESGYFSFILMTLNIPISLLANAVLDVFKEKAARDYRETGSCRNAYLETLKKMIILSILPFVTIFLIGDDLIRLLFGSQWIGAIEFLDIMLVMFFFKFISSPLTYIFFIVERQKEDFFWHVYILLTNILVLYVGAFMFENILLTLKLYSANFTFIYLIYLIRSYQISKL